MKSCHINLIAALLVASVSTVVRAQSVERAAVDAIFEQYAGTASPGCAIAVSRDGTEIFAAAYGMADLEHGVVNWPDTVFEPGSVSKQITAAATILLALDGLISLDDDIRKYFPELPDYGTPVTIRHLMNHTSGLRDWGAIAGIEGWPRTSRVHTHKHMLDIASRQRSLNYAPGEYYSYTNTGYNLQAVLVERVSGMSFADFSETRIFGPLGMTKTEWRDDFTRIVKDRAVGYRRAADGEWHMLMPFENVHGNGGLLTTVGDLLLFTRNLETGGVGGPAFIREMHTQGVLNSGTTIAYAGGLFVGTYKGLAEVSHSGATAAYRGYLTRYPDNGVAVSLMCNAANARTSDLAHQVADLYLGDAVSDYAEPEVESIALTDEALASFEGGYRSGRDRTFVRITIDEGGLRIGNGRLVPVGPSRFSTPDGGTELAFSGDGTGRLIQAGAPNEFLLPVEAYEPSSDALNDFVGRFRSDEAEVAFSTEVADGRLLMSDRYGDAWALVPLYADAFRSRNGTIIFMRNAGRVSGFSLVQGRVWNLEFQKTD